MPIKWEYEWCKMCERPNKIGFAVSDEEWKKIAPEGKDVLCYNCFEALSFEKGIPFTLIGLYPVARVKGCKFRGDKQ